MRKTILIVLYLLAISLMQAADDRLLTNSRHISTADGLPCNQVFDMQQDADGYIWLATANGLSRYDGYQFLNFYNLGTSGIHAVLGYVMPDDNGRHLWMQTSTYLFACYDMVDGRFVDFTGRGDDQHAYRKYLKDGYGIMWMFDDESGVRRIKASAGGTFSCIDYTKDTGMLPTSHVNDAQRDTDGRLWVMTTGGLTIIDREGKARTVTTETGFRKAIMAGNQVLTMTANSEIIIYDKTGRELKRKPFTDHVPVITGSFMWHGTWIILTQGGTFRVDPADGSLWPVRHFQINRGYVMHLSEDVIFVSNPTGTLWVFPREGDERQFNLMDGVESTVDRVRRYNVAKGSDGLYYIASHGNGLFVYDLEHDHMTHYSATSQAPLLNSNFLNNILIDRSGCIWLGEELTGLSCILPPTGLQADYLYPMPGQQGSWNNYVRMIHHNDDGSATLSTRDNRLYHFDPQTGLLRQLQKLGATVYTEKKDRQGHLWRGTRGGGLFIDGQHKDFASQHIYAINEDKQGRIWIGTWGDGLFTARLKDDGTLDYRQLLKRSYNESLIRCVKTAKDSTTWIATNNGVYSIAPGKKEVNDEDLPCSNMKNGRLPFDEVICLTCASDGHIWIGSRGGGLLCCQPKEGLLEIIKTFTTHEGMPSDNVYSAVEDRHGNIWVGTDNGVCRISPSMKVNSYLFGLSVQSNIYTENCATMLNDGRLLFGTIHGLMVLTSEDTSTTPDETDTAPIITSISINGISQYLSPRHHSLTVDYDQNSLVLNFSCLDFADRSATQYQYYMAGADKDWLPLTSEHQAHYNGLQPGTYHFHLRALGKNNQWGEETVFTIHIRQPWYNTWWAWLIYLLILGTIATYFYHFWRRNFKLHQQIKVEKELTSFRLSFFTHIAHEFRTPLAIISGAADKLTQKGNDEQISRSALQTVRRGTQRLTKLVNQLMEFRRVNTGNQRLGVIQTDIITLVRSTFDEFRYMANKKEQTLLFTSFAKKHEMLVDPQLVETILYNLLSNAVKYTPIKGSISLKIKQDDARIKIIVEDNGPGISAQQIPELYKPFMHGYVSQGGMGIGLYTASQLAKIHKGDLNYERVSDEGGSRFTLSLPANDEVYAASDYAAATAINTSPAEKEMMEEIRNLQPEAFNDYTVAIIEDDPDMIEQIRESISQFFITTCYSDGKSALNGIEEHQPDLILCDVMLPDINGYDIVKKLRANESLHDTPIIMLTALDGDNYLLKGYKAGADDYMVKPCNYELLILRITQLIQWYQRVQPAEAAVQQSATATTIITDEADQRFKEKVEAIVSRRLGEPDFTVDVLAAQLKMGRTKFYGKMKELTGTSPNSYLQTKRLSRAAELLIEGDLNVTEVSYEVGFQTPTYFYKCFKEKYGVPPSRYGKKRPASPEE